jgi:hypothetical protein
VIDAAQQMADRCVRREIRLGQSGAILAFGFSGSGT